MIKLRKPRHGLDLGRASVKLVTCEGDSVRHTERRVDSGLTDQALHDALVGAVREATQELGIKPGAELHVAVPRAQAIVKRLVMPHVPADELERMIRFQASKSLPFDLSEVALTWNGVGGADASGGQVVMFAAVREEVLEHTRSVVEAAGFKAGSLEISTQAAARTLALQHPPEVGSETLLVEVGHASSDVIVFEGQDLMFTRSASVGCGDDPAGDDQWLTRLAQEVVRSVVAARTGDADASGELDPERSGAPTALYLGGGAAALESLRQVLSAEVGIEPQVLSGLGPDAAPETGARFVVARGLADPRRLPGVPELDFARRTEAVAVRSQRQRAVSVGAGALLVLAVVFGAIQFSLSGRAETIETLKAEKLSLAPTVAKARELRDQLATVEEWDARKGRELELFRAVSRALPEGEQVYLTRMRWSEGRQLRISGRAKSWDAVAMFLTKLEGEPLIRSAAFDSIRKPTEKGALGVEFSGQATLEQTP